MGGGVLTIIPGKVQTPDVPFNGHKHLSLMEKNDGKFPKMFDLTCILGAKMLSVNVARTHARFTSSFCEIASSIRFKISFGSVPAVDSPK